MLAGFVGAEFGKGDREGDGQEGVGGRGRGDE